MYCFSSDPGRQPHVALHPFIHAALLGAVLALTGCGGGGGGGNDVAAVAEPTPAAPVAKAPDAPPAATEAAGEWPSGTYAAGSAEQAAWNVLQASRSQCGFGVLEQDVRLDAASRAHARYLLAEGSAGTFAIGHAESNGNNPYFTGAYATDRAQQAGYGPYVIELLTASTETYVSVDPMPQPTAADRGERDMRALLNSVAHLSGAMASARVGGLAVETKQDRSTASDGMTTLVVNQRLGVLIGQQESLPLLGAGKVASYPCAGTLDASYAFAPATEEPNPFPAVTDPNVQMGPPIYLRADDGSDLRVTSYSLKDASGTVLPVRTNAVPRQGHEFFMVPKQKLSPDSRYTVDLQGTANGASFHQAFEFRTHS